MSTRAMPLTPDEARAVLWPFASPRRPIGELLATGRITEVDLWRATRVAYSRRVKSACAILLTLIRQPIVTVTPIQPARSTAPPIPATCPICGDRVWPDHRWDCAKHGPGWRCETRGLTHCLQLRYLDQLKAVYAPDAWVIPPQGVTRAYDAVIWRAARSAICRKRINNSQRAGVIGLIGPITPASLHYGGNSHDHHHSRCNGALRPTVWQFT